VKMFKSEKTRCKNKLIQNKNYIFLVYLIIQTVCFQFFLMIMFKKKRMKNHKFTKVILIKELSLQLIICKKSSRKTILRRYQFRIHWTKILSKNLIVLLKNSWTKTRLWFNKKPKKQRNWEKLKNKRNI